MPDDRAAYLKTRQVAEEYPLSVKLLEKLRSQGHGPAFIRRGRSVFYRRKDVEAWIEAGRVATSD